MTSAVAGKIAAQVCAGTGDLDLYLKVKHAVHDNLLQTSNIGVTAPAAQAVAPPLQQVPPQQAVANVAQGFPGAQVVAQPAAEWTPDQLWMDVINNPGNWYDNRGDTRSASQGGIGPDFRCKATGPKPKAGLWLFSPKYGNYAPDWVFQRLNIPKPVPQQTAAVQPTAVPGPATPAPGAPAAVLNQAPAAPAPYQPGPDGSYGPDQAPF